MTTKNFLVLIMGACLIGTIAIARPQAAVGPALIVLIILTDMVMRQIRWVEEAVKALPR
jgi:hypothetical protein